MYDDGAEGDNLLSSASQHGVSRGNKWPDKPIRLYSMTYSGHGHRVELFLSLLGLPYEKINVDPKSGFLKQLEYRRLNPHSLVPVIVDGDVTLHESTAILVYLARTYGDNWLPDDPVREALVQQWFSYCSGPIAYGPCAARRLVVYDEELVPFVTAIDIATKFFSVAEEHFSKHVYAIGDMLTVADIAAYTYIAHAPEGGISLEPYPNLTDWLNRIEDLPGFVRMPRAPEPSLEDA
ncbi:MULTISPECIES: glutathione S-transferase family protein [Burkholderiaceae]|uniref:glutathione S-transferase family protein n=1 Tax=Burkholderiaceae TaxID=119060 RepID=UPI00074B5043|nr:MULTISPECIES: glutathione S-transferase family protein [Burkholderiaceae]SAL77673.1 glutathione S-transferase [Caballeronia peredens]